VALGPGVALEPAVERGLALTVELTAGGLELTGLELAGLERAGWS
jgi:hypothetical protein